MIPVTQTTSSTSAATPASLGNPENAPANQDAIASKAPIPMIHAQASRAAITNSILGPGFFHSPTASEHMPGLMEPGSPTRSSKKKSGVREKQSRKRSIDSADGPGSEKTGSSKCPRQSTPPNSPRASTAGKQLIRSPRAVADLISAAGLPQRRSESASLPLSPRSASNDDQQDIGRVRADSPRQPAVGGRGARADSAPIWVNASYKERAANATQDGPILSPRRGSLTSPRVASAPFGSHPLSSTSLTIFPQDVQAARQSQHSDFRQTDGMEASSMSMLFINAELSIVRAALLDALAAHKLDHNADSALSTSSTSTSSQQSTDLPSHPERSKLRQDELDIACNTLEWSFMVADLAADAENDASFQRVLGEIVKDVAACRNVLPSSGITPDANLDRVQAALDSVEIACTHGLAALSEERLHKESLERTDATGTATAVSTAPARLPITLSTVALMDDLSSLMDEEIVVTLPVAPVPKSEPKQ